jgi:hypothetical protein
VCLAMNEPQNVRASQSHQDAFVRERNPADTLVAAIIFDKQLRVDIDALVQRLKAAPKSAERTLTFRALQTAKHWLGEDLAVLGAANPYPNSKDVTNTTVDPTADVAVVQK